MKCEISNYYKQKGYDKLYVNINKEPRRVAKLTGDSCKKTNNNELC